MRILLTGLFVSVSLGLAVGCGISEGPSLIGGSSTGSSNSPPVPPNPPTPPTPPAPGVCLVTASVSLSPASGQVGTLLTLTGTDANMTDVDTVTIGGQAAMVLEKTDSTVKVLLTTASNGAAVVTRTTCPTLNTTNSFTHATSSNYISVQQGSKIVSPGTAYDQLGYATAISADGNTFITNVFSSPGGGKVFTRSGTTWTQQGLKFTGTGSVGNARQGRTVALSADGNTAVLGSIHDNSNRGAAWVFTRSNGTWTQQGAKIVGTGFTGSPGMGVVALSADGNTLAMGGGGDNSNNGAVWVFTRTNGVWAQVGGKLTPSDAAAPAGFGESVSLSGDGQYMLIGGSLDDAQKGAAWIFHLSGGTWTQQGTKLVGTGAIGNASQGVSGKLNMDGSLAIVGGSADNGNRGAAWVYSRAGTTWSQDTKLVSVGIPAGAQMGSSVSMDAEGNQVLLGAPTVNTNTGANYLFTRSANVWTARPRLVGSGFTGESGQSAGSISMDGSTAAVGGSYDDDYLGAAWVFIRP